jgi:hypothetical protein
MPNPDRNATPFPWISIVRIADALGNRPDMNIAVINVPAVMAVVCGSAAGEGGHGGGQSHGFKVAGLWQGQGVTPSPKWNTRIP